jgi:hypothetical protein
MRFVFTVSMVALFITCTGQTYAQVNSSWFVRLPHVVNYNMGDHSTSYASVISAGINFNYKTFGVDLGAFITDQDSHGYYTFFGSSLHQKTLGETWLLATNWFGEVTYLPPHDETSSVWVHTAGISLIPMKSFEWGSVGFPLLAGVAYSNNSFSINARIIANLSIKIR